jgi:hypothetical protein
VAEELGTWPAEQATVLLEVLQKAGLDPTAKRTRDGILVTVPEGQADEAHRQLVANMDTIARAARPPAGSRPRARRPRPVKGADSPAARGGGLGRGGQPSWLAGRGLIGAIVAVLILGVVLRYPLLVVPAVGALIYVLGKRAQAQGDDPGDPRRGR